jgi:hypothetical protein
MSDVQNQQPSPQQPRPQAKDPLALLTSLVPTSVADRRRSVTALLRALLGDGQQGGS